MVQVCRVSGFTPTPSRSRREPRRNTNKGFVRARVSGGRPARARLAPLFLQSARLERSPLSLSLCHRHLPGVSVTSSLGAASPHLSSSFLLLETSLCVSDSWHRNPTCDGLLINSSLSFLGNANTGCAHCGCRCYISAYYTDAAGVLISSHRRIVCVFVSLLTFICY